MDCIWIKLWHVFFSKFPSVKERCFCWSNSLGWFCSVLWIQCVWAYELYGSQTLSSLHIIIIINGFDHLCRDFFWVNLSYFQEDEEREKSFAGESCQHHVNPECPPVGSSLIIWFAPPGCKRNDDFVLLVKRIETASIQTHRTWRKCSNLQSSKVRQTLIFSVFHVVVVFWTYICFARWLLKSFGGTICWRIFLSWSDKQLLVAWVASWLTLRTVWIESNNSACSN